MPATRRNAGGVVVRKVSAVSMQVSMINEFLDAPVPETN
jgi:hypothetical protein